jgi:hypothetical protein
MKLGAPSLQSTRLLYQLRECFQCNYYSFSTEKYYFYWFFIVRWSGRGAALLTGIIKPVSVCTFRMSVEAIFAGRVL